MLLAFPLGVLALSLHRPHLLNGQDGTAVVANDDGLASGTDSPLANGLDSANGLPPRSEEPSNPVDAFTQSWTEAADRVKDMGEERQAAAAPILEAHKAAEDKAKQDMLDGAAAAGAAAAAAEAAEAEDKRLEAEAAAIKAGVAPEVWEVAGEDTPAGYRPDADLTYSGDRILAEIEADAEDQEEREAKEKRQDRQAAEADGRRWLAEKEREDADAAAWIPPRAVPTPLPVRSSMPMPCEGCEEAKAAEEALDNWQAELRRETDVAIARLNEQRQSQLTRCTQFEAQLQANIEAMTAMQVQVRRRAVALDTSFDAAVQRLSVAYADAVATRRGQQAGNAGAVPVE